MVDPTSDVAETDDPDAAPECAACGEPVAGAERRVITWVADGEARYAEFCDDACLAAWDDERPTADG